MEGTLEPGQIQELAKHWEVLITLLIVGLTQIIKTALPAIPARIVPLANVLMGIGFMGVLTAFTIEAVIAGMMIGFAAAGLWSSSKTVINKTGGAG